MVGTTIRMWGDLSTQFRESITSLYTDAKFQKNQRKVLDVSYV